MGIFLKDINLKGKTALITGATKGLGRVAKESDVATAVAFLAAESSEMITGTSLLVDGGWTAQ